MKTVRIYHDGQYWRGFKHGIVGTVFGLCAIMFIASGQQMARSQTATPSCAGGTIFRGMQGSVALCEAPALNADRSVLPTPTWWTQFPDAARLSGDALRELDRNGLRPVPAAQAATIRP
jgi:hypothetical protein